MDKCQNAVARLGFFCYHIYVFTCGKSKSNLTYTQIVDKLWIVVHSIINKFFNNDVDNVYNYSYPSYNHIFSIHRTISSNLVKYVHI